jgi:hypothetical protein
MKEEDILHDNKSGRTFTKKQFKKLKEKLKKEHKIKDKKNKKTTKKEKKNEKASRKEKKDVNSKKDEGTFHENDEDEDVNDMGVKKKVLDVVKQGEKSKEVILEKIDKALEKADEKNLDRISLTDPDAHWRPNKQHYFQLVHNFQIIGDTDSRFIIHNDVVDAATDMNQLKPLMDEIQTEIGYLDENTLLNADNGYFSGNNLKYIEEQGFNGLIPNKTQASQSKGKKIGKFHKHNFTYDHVNDTYKCPNEKILRLSKHKPKKKLNYITVMTAIIALIKITAIKRMLELFHHTKTNNICKK